MQHFFAEKFGSTNLEYTLCRAEQGHTFLWTENQDKRGTDDITSVLFKFLKEQKDVDHLSLN